MTDKPSIWTRIHHFFSPPRESYDTRIARPGGDPASLTPQHSDGADYRRHGGSAGPGAVGG
jgi:hypothetical protein